MKQYISTAAAAFTLVGAIGLAYAQGEQQPADTNATTPQTQQDPAQPPVTDPAITPLTPTSAASANTTSVSTSTDVVPAADTQMTNNPTGSMANDTTSTTERAPQADRN